jgi:hypothetical protein
MNKETGYDSRIEFRIDSKTKKDVALFCEDQKIDVSEFARDALVTRLREKKLVGVLMRYMQNEKFYNIFNQFWISSNKEVQTALELLLGPEEQILIQKLPDEFISTAKVMTKMGKEILTNRLKQI